MVCRRHKEGGRESELRATALVLHLTFTKDNEIFISTPEKCGECCITNKRRKNNIANQYKITERCLKHREDIPNVPLMKTDHFGGKWAVSYSSPTSWQMLQRRVSSPPHIRKCISTSNLIDDTAKPSAMTYHINAKIHYALSHWCSLTFQNSPTGWKVASQKSLCKWQIYIYIYKLGQW